MCAFLVLLSSTAHAATRAAAVVPRISFNGTTASCTVFVAADRPTDDIEAVIKLWQGSKCTQRWLIYVKVAVHTPGTTLIPPLAS